MTILTSSTHVIFLSRMQMVGNVWLRPGKTADSSNYVSFMQEILERCLVSKEVGWVRADSGVYNEEILNYLETENKDFAIAIRMNPNVNLEILKKKKLIALTKVCKTKCTMPQSFISNQL